MLVQLSVFNAGYISVNDFADDVAGDDDDVDDDFTGESETGTASAKAANGFLCS